MRPSAMNIDFRGFKTSISSPLYQELDNNDGQQRNKERRKDCQKPRRQHGDRSSYKAEKGAFTVEHIGNISDVVVCREIRAPFFLFKIFVEIVYAHSCVFRSCIIVICEHIPVPYFKRRRVVFKRVCRHRLSVDSDRALFGRAGRIHIIVIVV